MTLCLVLVVDQALDHRVKTVGVAAHELLERTGVPGLRTGHQHFVGDLGSHRYAHDVVRASQSRRASSLPRAPRPL